MARSPEPSPGLTDVKGRNPSGSQDPREPVAMTAPIPPTSSQFYPRTGADVPQYPRERARATRSFRPDGLDHPGARPRPCRLRDLARAFWIPRRARVAAIEASTWPEERIRRPGGPGDPMPSPPSSGRGALRPGPAGYEQVPYCQPPLLRTARLRRLTRGDETFPLRGRSATACRPVAGVRTASEG
jgi:hypothetical protein